MTIIIVTNRYYCNFIHFFIFEKQKLFDYKTKWLTLRILTLPICYDDDILKHKQKQKQALANIGATLAPGDVLLLKVSRLLLCHKWLKKRP